MNRITRGASFDYVLSLDGIGPTDFVGWTTECYLRDFSGKLIATIPSQWVDPAVPVALELFEIDTSKWRLGTAVMDVHFTSPDGYVRTLEDKIQWEITQ